MSAPTHKHVLDLARKLVFAAERMTKEEKEEANGYRYNAFREAEGQVSRVNVHGQTIHGKVADEKARQDRIATAPSIGFRADGRLVHDTGMTKTQIRDQRRDVPVGKSSAGLPDYGASPQIQRYKKGGIVKKTGVAVVHKGELVVPAEVVPKVLKSNAWLDHVRAVRAKHGGTMKDAMKIAKGTYRKKN
jgi:hypothetical protein